MSLAIVLHVHGGPEKLVPEDVVAGPVGTHDIRVRQTAIGVNFHDVYVRAGLYQTLEQGLGVVKRLWGFGKVRYSGLQNNATHAFTALALTNIYLGRVRLMAQVRP